MSWARSASVSAHTASAACRSKPPAKTALRRNRIRSGSVSNECDQSMDASRVCCRRTAVRAPPVSSRKLDRRLSRIWVIDNVRVRAAANSIASGMPSRRRQISVTVVLLSSQDQVWPDTLGAVDEQLHGLAVDGQRRHPPRQFPGNPQRFRGWSPTPSPDLRRAGCR